MFKINLESVQEHLNFLDKDTHNYAFASYTEKGREDRSSVSVRLFGSLNEHAEHMQGFQDRYAALYVSVNAMKPASTSATKEDISQIRALFIDMDDPTATLDDLHAFPLPAHRIVETSPGKHQVYWLVDGLTVPEAEGFTRWLVKHFNADRGVWDAARVFRLPGSWHLKAEPFQVRVVHTLDSAPYTIDQIDAAGVQWAPQQARSATTDYTPPSHVDVDKLVTLVNGGDEQYLELWEATRKAFNTNGIDGSRYHMAIASMIRKCRLPIEAFDVYLRAWVAKNPAGDRQNKIDRPGYVAMTWAKNTMGIALRSGETWEGWRKRRDGVMTLFDDDAVGDDGEPDIDGLEEFLVGCSDDALAIKAANSFRGNMRFTTQTGRWHMWDGLKWSEDTTSRAKDAVRTFLRTVSGQAAQHADELTDTAKSEPKDVAAELLKMARKMSTLATRLRKAATLRDIMSMLVLERRDGAEVVTSHEEWNRHDTLMATPGGVIDLRTGKMMADGRRFFCSRSTAVEPAEEGARPERWLKFLGDVFDDLEVIEFLHRYLGYALTGYTREECFVFGFGDGRNGKGVLTGTVAQVMGGYAKTVDADLFTMAGAGQHKSGLAGIYGFRMVLSSEIPDGAAWNLQRIKTLTGGDEIEANFMRQDKFVFRPNLSLIICANDKPALKNVDNSIRARFRFVNFPHSFIGKEDTGLKEDLKEEYPAILRWLIDGAAKYLKSGLTYPDSIRRATEAYLDEANVLKNWFDDVKWSGDGTEPQVEESHFTAVDLMGHYAKYCRNMSVKGVGKHAFLDYLRGKGLEQTRKSFKYRYRGQMLVWGPFNDIKSIG